MPIDFQSLTEPGMSIFVPGRSLNAVKEAASMWRTASGNRWRLRYKREADGTRVIRQWGNVSIPGQVLYAAKSAPIPQLSMKIRLDVDVLTYFSVRARESTRHDLIRQVLTVIARDDILGAVLDGPAKGA